MNIEHLKAFYKVAREGSFTKAAGTLYITQSAVSQQIQALENSLKIKLFDRSGRKILLTSQGESLLSYAKKMFALYEEIEAVFELQQTLEKGKNHHCVYPGHWNLLPATNNWFIQQAISRYRNRSQVRKLTPYFRYHP